MHVFRFAALLGILFGSVACHTPIQVKATAGVGPKWEDGVPFYLPEQFLRKFRLTKFEQNGVVTSNCDPIEDAEYVTIANLERLYMIRSHDFFFGQNTFGVALDKGMLTSVNSVRDPQVDEMVGAVAGAAKTFAALAMPPAPAPEDATRPDCNAGKRYLTPLPERLIPREDPKKKEVRKDD